MEQTTLRAIEASVYDVVRKNHDNIAEKLLNGTTHEMSEQTLTTTMISNCVCVSTALAVQVMLGLLQECQILDIDEHQLAKMLLKHLSSPEAK